MESLKNVVITGANRGIGLALCTIYAKMGFHVIALCRKSSIKLDSLGIEVVSSVDISTPEGVLKISDAIASRNIDILINNAGILRDESLDDLNLATINEQFLVNAVAPLNVCHALLDNLSKGSKIALITSRMGSIADNSSGGRYGYRMSKAALNAAGMSLARDLAPQGVMLGVYHPGYVQTDMVGNRGDISAKEAATRISKLIGALTPNESGKFRHSNGEELPW